jgi:hypothetical protein
MLFNKIICRESGQSINIVQTRRYELFGLVWPCPQKLCQLQLECRHVRNRKKGDLQCVAQGIEPLLSVGILARRVARSRRRRTGREWRLRLPTSARRRVETGEKSNLSKPGNMTEPRKFPSRKGWPSHHNFIRLRRTLGQLQTDDDID